MSFEEGHFFFLLCRWLFCGFYIIFFKNPHPKQCTQSMFSQIQNPSSGFCLNLTCQGGKTEIEALHFYCIQFYFDRNGCSGELIACFYFSLRGGCTATGEATILTGSWNKTDRHKALKKTAERPSPCYEQGLLNKDRFSYDSFCERLKWGKISPDNLNSLIFHWDMCFPFPGLLRYVIKHTLFDFFFSLPLNRSGCGNAVRSDVKNLIFRSKQVKRQSGLENASVFLNTHGLRNKG